MDLVSQSLEKLQPLPSGPEKTRAEITDRLQTLIEYSDRGNREAQFSVGQHYLQEGKLPLAVKYLKRAEQGDNNQARYQLAVMYYDGLGVEADPSLGFTLMMQVAQSTSSKDKHLIASAQFNIGRAYYQGFGVEHSDDEAIRWWTQAASTGNEQPSVRAMNTLAMTYSRSDTLDINKAFYWHSQAALNGHLESMAALGLLYLKGDGCKKDRETALYWMKRSSEGGSIYGTGVLAHYYYCNKFFTRAVETAHRISALEASVKELAEQSSALHLLVAKGIAMACFILARCLQLGQAVSKNEDLARTYFDRASKFDKTAVAELHTQMMYGKM